MLADNAFIMLGKKKETPHFGCTEPLGRISMSKTRYRRNN